MEKLRLDVILTERGLVESRSIAQRMIMAGEVRVNGQLSLKPASKYPQDVEITLKKMPPYVSRGGEKLAGALSAFHLDDLEGRVCADVGASTGGFTDCLLQHGASRVYAIDVGYGLLHWKLRQDPRVILLERTNARHLNCLEEPVQLVTIDASFISLRILLPVVSGWLLESGGEVITLIKPQFEAGRQDAARGDGVIRDPLVHRQVLEQVLRFSAEEGFELRGLVRSPLLGPKGNVEFLAHFVYPQQNLVELEKFIGTVLQG